MRKRWRNAYSYGAGSQRYIFISSIKVSGYAGAVCSSFKFSSTRLSAPPPCMRRNAVCKKPPSKFALGSDHPLVVGVGRNYRRVVVLGRRRRYVLGHLLLALLGMILSR